MKTHILTLLSAVAIASLASCGGGSSSTSSSQEGRTSTTTSEATTESKTSGETTTEEQSPKTYNIIMTAATVPPVLSALECLTNGADATYAYIERGKTYSGIAALEDHNFFNLGFDVTANLNNGIPIGAINTIVDKVKELKEEDPDATFNLFTTDYKVWAAVKVASDAELDLDDFKVYMVEDGTATYTYSYRFFMEPFNRVEESDEFYAYCKTEALSLLDSAMEDSSAIESVRNGFVECYGYTFALASHPNFVHLMQDATKMAASFSKFADSEIYREYVGEKTANVVYDSISNRVAHLTEEQKDLYLNLMFGSFKEESYRLLTRKKNDTTEDAVPEKKLIYIGTRAAQSDLSLIPDVTSIPASYTLLNLSLREFFTKEEDYNLVLNYLNDESKYEDTFKDASNEVKAKIKVAAFNTYIGFAYNLKIAYRLYGGQYDVLFKGHPAETFESIESWNRYKLTVDGTEYTYNKYMYHLAKLFHEQDSEGRYIGVLPGGVAAENLAYLGVDTYVGGLPSSTYTGYEKTAPILFVFNNIDGDIHSDGNIIQRYLDGELTWEVEGETINTHFYNKGHLYKQLKELYLAYDGIVYSEISQNYNAKLTEWLKKVIKVDEVEGCDVDVNGSPVLTPEVLTLAREERIDEVNQLIRDADISGLDEGERQALEAAVILAREEIGAATTVYELDKAVDDFKAFLNILLPEEGE